MALTRGAKADFPCPVCLVPNAELHKGNVYEGRTSESMQNVYMIAQGMRTAQERKKYLKGYGLRYIKVW